MEAWPAAATALVEQLQPLAQGRGWFDGGAWQPELDAWQGRKHQLLQSLATELERLQPPPTTRTLSARLGPLLQSCTAGQDLAPDADCAWISWRGRRDGLRLSLAAGRLQRLQWQLALEQQ
ncbi:hypothetical protein G8A07_16485 [Roseateles sp. DAIF2]|uniref:hypothetical protein n=1 Tax=Roseateles sp. DAIF2 TaxID=2714952 RepID=UPI0018A2AD39|nr:hypothetical protein [Roseateles sp. DAIF2]QPF74362.1 hypothetical protein G8A07_16485 [Roseateles sp. DAIF2]